MLGIKLVIHENQELSTHYKRVNSILYPLNAQNSHKISHFENFEHFVSHLVLHFPNCTIYVSSSRI